MNSVDLLICPLCRNSLTRINNSLKCINNHSYDISSSGYVNLMPPGKASNKSSGDDKNMIVSRSEFLEKGYYDSLTDELSIIVKKYLKKDEINMLDCGTGDGYHSNRLFALLSSSLHVNLIGIDASKNGVNKASKRANKANTNSIKNQIIDCSNEAFIVGNIFDIPVKDNSVDCLLSCFAPIPYDEVLRTLSKDGVFVVISSGLNHLWEFREALYDVPKTSKCNVFQSDSFVNIESLTLTNKINLESNADILNLFTMTPFYYRTSQKDKDKLYKLSSLVTTIEFDINVYKKK